MLASRSLLDRCLLPLALLGFAACAKTGDPQPPLVLVPKPAADLAARQFSDRILLTVTPPAVHTDGSPVTTPGRVEVFLLGAESRNDAGPVPEDIFLTRGVKIFSVPAADFTRHLQDGKLAFWDVSAAADPAAFYTRSFRYAVLFFNRKNQTAGLSNQAFLAPIPIPVAPAGLSCAFFPDLIRLSWTPPEKNGDGSVPPRIAGYNVYRTEDPKAVPAAPLNRRAFTHARVRGPGF